jgi:hypothetical protein
MRIRAFVLAGAFLFLSCLAYSQASTSALPANPVEEEKDPIAIVEIGASGSWNFSGGATSFAPNLAVETTPIENWLELELGVSPYYTRNSTEWDVDLLFKKPWTLSRTAEFMFGVGPEWVHIKQHQTTGDNDEHHCR